MQIAKNFIITHYQSSIPRIYRFRLMMASEMLIYQPKRTHRPHMNYRRNDTFQTLKF